MHSVDNTLGHARLGLIVSKKVAKRANKRNYMKRVIRDWFRHHKHQLPTQDFIVRVRLAFDRDTALQARQQLAELMLPKTKWFFQAAWNGILLFSGCLNI